ncbi:DUF5625 family protein [Reyranella sp. CPCC 100927]|uniref:DUF5625 family protein n=1 Tax=Reyranella sp. CPCC 100927 TaxID=2599616 RepID=UPI0011B7F401|nr:DUF5625 family protein [Reyranella sp. CPCC 100927]TWT13027.1 hypothetical protein FQU96_12375 [Reyranella sp. CPCC 100927]
MIAVVQAKLPYSPACFRRSLRDAARRVTCGFIGFLAVLWTAVPAVGQTNLPQPHTRFRFDISEPESSITEKFEIKRKRQYQFVIEVNYVTLAEADRIQRLIGTGQRFPDGRYYAPGVVIPVQFKIERIVERTARQLIFDEMVPVQGRIYQLLGPTSTSGNYGRLIAELSLERGIYEMRARTTTRIPDFDGIPTSLAVTYDGRVQYTD